MPKKISHKQKSRKHSGRRTKKYTRKQKGGSGNGSLSRRDRGDGLSSTSNFMKQKKAESRERQKSTVSRGNNEDPLPEIPVVKVNVNPNYIPYNPPSVSKVARELYNTPKSNAVAVDVQPPHIFSNNRESPKVPKKQTSNAPPLPPKTYMAHKLN